ncbi:hypothetical protein GGR50DRAFT_651738 [Xylaria sp. CBS 124048]|nr:hypothetical protein GGR50DRAFT_651738 [Xylaria sp. CBS 124048]
MADARQIPEASSSRSSTALTPAGIDDPTAARPRNRRAPPSRNSALYAATTNAAGPSRSSSRGVSPMPAERLSDTKPHMGGLSGSLNGGFSRGLLEGSWAPNWSSVQDFATSLLDGGYSSEPSRPNSRNGQKSQPKSFWKSLGGMDKLARNAPENWGPAPTSNSRLASGDIATGSLAERQAQLMARKKASVLESHDGVNGGLDVTGQYKRRNSDENLRSVSQPVIEDFLVYLHHVRPEDTYAGVILRYRCMEHAFRKVNGLWSRDTIQIRKHLLIPVDSCELKGRPCEPPARPQRADHIAAPSPYGSDFTSPSQPNAGTQQRLHDEYFGSLNEKTVENTTQETDDRPWTHVRWVKLDSLQEPVEIVRVKRTSVGYFPPRRKKSLHTGSTLSTPRQSLELSKATSNTPGLAESPRKSSSRRQSTISNRPSAASIGSPNSARSRGNSSGQSEGIPAWMRKPGGVGSMGKNVKAPGPPSDPFNKWVNKRLPGLTMDSLPSMSVMGSETAHFGFSNPTQEGAGIVESPFEDGGAVTPSQNGLGLEQAAASIETWLREAWAKRPGTPRLGSLRRATDDIDLIELTEAINDDGRPVNLTTSSSAGPSSQGSIDPYSHGSSSRSAGEGAASFRRGRSATAADKGKKVD